LEGEAVRGSKWGFMAVGGVALGEDLREEGRVSCNSSVWLLSGVLQFVSIEKAMASVCHRQTHIRRCNILRRENNENITEGGCGL
jgi:hypothetical protein